jgi:hypothetical protein
MYEEMSEQFLLRPPVPRGKKCTYLTVHGRFLTVVQGVVAKKTIPTSLKGIESRPFSLPITNLLQLLNDGMANVTNISFRRRIYLIMLLIIN